MLTDPADSCGGSVEAVARPLFGLDGVTVRGSGRDRLQRVTLRIGSGVTAILGNSGAGKTSLLNVLADFEQPDTGSRTLSAPLAGGLKSGGAGPARLPLFWVPQGGGLWPHLTVRQHVTGMIGPGLRAVPVGNSDLCGISADELLAVFDLAERWHALPAELSQGERSRLAVARALASGARVLLLDEPLAHVDVERRSTYWRLMRRVFQETGTSVVFASHEPDTVIRESSRVICLSEGRVVFEGGTRDLYENPPDLARGQLLGRLNWFSPHEIAAWLTQEGCPGAAFRGGGLRPESVEVQVTESGVLEVVWTVTSGSYVESLVKHPGTGQERILVHGPATVPVRARDRVQIVVRGQTC